MLATIVATAWPVAPVDPTMIIAPPILAIILTVTVTLLVTGDVLVVVPAIADEIDPLVTGIVGAAVPAPVFGMTRWYMQVDRWAAGWPAPDHARLGIEDLRPRIPSCIA